MKRLLFSIFLILLAHAGFSQSADTTFQGKVVSTAPDAVIVSHKWSQLSGPNTANIVSPNAQSTKVSNLVAGVYVFQYEITDNFGFKGTSNKKVTVNRYSQLPVADAGGDIIIQLGKP